MNMKEKTRVLHILWGLSTGGGVPTWLLSVMQHMELGHYQMDVLPWRYDYGHGAGDNYEYLVDDFCRLGSHIYREPAAARTGRAVNGRLRRIMASYDIVHLHDLDGTFFVVACLAGCRHRVLHLHVDKGYCVSGGRWIGRVLRNVKAFLAIRLASERIAVSKAVGETAFPGEKWRLLYCGIDMDTFGREYNRETIRKSLGISGETYTVGMVGTLSPTKNQMFALDVFQALRLRKPNAHLLLIGPGSSDEISIVKRRISEYGLVDCVTLTGPRNDVPVLLKGAIDAYLFPSISEGLGLSVVEAQAAGLPCLVSDRVPKDAFVIPELISVLPLEASAETWARRLVEISQCRYLSCDEAYEVMRNSRFNIERSARSLEQLYRSLMKRDR